MSEFTTIEKQAMKTSPCYGAIVQWKERVFVTDMDRYGKYTAKIYEMVDSEDAPSRIEARLSLIKEADESFPDSGQDVYKRQVRKRRSGSLINRRRTRTIRPQSR